MFIPHIKVRFDKFVSFRVENVHPPFKDLAPNFRPNTNGYFASAAATTPRKNVGKTVRNRSKPAQLVCREFVRSL